MNRTRLISFFSLLSLLFLLVSCASENTVPSGMKPLESDMTLGYTVYVPEEWIQDKSEGMVSAYAGYGDPSSFSVVGFLLDREDYGLTAEEYWERYRADFESTFSDFTPDESSPEAILLDGIAARKYVFDAKVTGVECRFLQVVCIHDATVYLLTYTAQPSLFDRHTEDVEKILSYFDFD